MISKKLLSEVLGYPKTIEANIPYEINIEDISGFISDNKSDLYFNTDNVGLGVAKINIHELAHKCKEWARINSFHITSWLTMTDEVKGGVTVGHSVKDIEEQLIFAQTEPEAIFKACEWILNEIM